MISLTEIVGYSIDASIGPVYGYYEQYKMILNNKSVGMFSINVCAILLISNILRILFWLTTGYAINLLFQSFFVIIIQLFLLEICIRLNGENMQNIQLTVNPGQEVEQNKKKKSHSSIQNVQQSFWRWNTFYKYLKFLVIMTLIFGIITTIFIMLNYPIYGQILGFLSMSIQATLGFPQLLSNHLSKKVKGLSIIMIMSWFIGDFFKTIYFFYLNQPIQFIMCGSIQLTVDILIISQMYIYSDKTNYEEVVQSVQRI